MGDYVGDMTHQAKIQTDRISVGRPGKWVKYHSRVVLIFSDHSGL